ncbi:hypothetical protein MERGE_001925 [Pneumocystis wakefieldiae]|uniref:Uncharacterized protein n=1 Tax=Pneumocystis wakefieldiae TaxID=38082 RepID=A0A899FWE3_9ASCO|nr:hypothetical protein MERGE_001925 [Pneumocystis wakefieldiae]
MLHYFYKKCAAIRRNNLVDKAAVISNTLVDGNNKNYENVFDWAIKFRNNNEINHVLTVNIGIEDTKALIWLMTGSFLNIDLIKTFIFVIFQRT